MYASPERVHGVTRMMCCLDSDIAGLTHGHARSGDPPAEMDNVRNGEIVGSLSAGSRRLFSLGGVKYCQRSQNLQPKAQTFRFFHSGH